MRGPTLNIGTVSRIVGFVAVSAAIVATAVHLRHDDISAGATGGAAATSAQSDSLARELGRCRAIGMAAKDDSACEAAWAENRRRFFTYRSSPNRATPTPSINRPGAATPEDR